MSKVRFATARSLFESFPELSTQISVAPTSDNPVAFLRNLSSQDKFGDAVTFCAHLLPRREAVWWACKSSTAFLGDIVESAAGCLKAAEAWVGVPNDANRRAALEAGEQADKDDPLTWLALAAGWSGGMLFSEPKAPVAVPPYLTARAVRIAIMLSEPYVSPGDAAARRRACIADGIELAEHGLG